MTATAGAPDLTPPVGATAGPERSMSGQLRKLARRSIARTLRDQKIVVPNVVFPLFLLAVFSSAGSNATHIKGFPTDSYLTFMLGTTFIQGAIGAANLTGTLLAADLETGFMSRTLLTPVGKISLILSQLAGPVVLVAGQSVLFLGIGLIFGAHIEAGVPGAFALIGVVVLQGIAFGAIGLVLGSLAGSATQVQGLASVLAVTLFLSSMLMPRNLITHDWFKTIATYNPMSYLVEATRSLLISGWDKEALALGCGIGLVGILLAVPLAAVSLRRRLERT